MPTIYDEIGNGSRGSFDYFNTQRNSDTVSNFWRNKAKFLQNTPRIGAPNEYISPMSTFNSGSGKSPFFHSGDPGTPGSGNIPTPRGIPTPDSGGFGWNFDTLNLASKAIGGIGNLASGYAALKNIGVARDNLNFKRDAFNQQFGLNKSLALNNLGNLVTTTNNQITNRNTFKKAQGRTDFDDPVTANL